jgi:hypothetical protein
MVVFGTDVLGTGHGHPETKPSGARKSKPIAGAISGQMPS